MGLANTPMGLGIGLVFFVFPQLMAERHVPEATIATISAVAMSANFWTLFLGPILDVRFSRRGYATSLAVVTAALIVLALFSLDNILLLEVALVAASATSFLSASAFGGWVSQVCSSSQMGTLSAWINIAAFLGIGIMSALGGPVIHSLPLPLAAASLALLLLLPCLIFLLMPAQGPDRRLAGESFSQFNTDILALLRRREVVLGLLLFISPCGSFALTAILGGLGHDFGASQQIISLAGGAGAIIPGVLGCLLYPLLARRVPLRYLYLANGTLGGLFTLSLAILPHTQSTFLLALVGQYLFQAMAYATQCGIVFQIIGPDNPLAATNFIFMLGVTNIPVTYMLFLDGRAYAAGSLTRLFATDAGLSIAMCLIWALVFRSFRTVGR